MSTNPYGRKLDERQLVEMAEMRERGDHPREIAKHFQEQGISISESAIDWQCIRLGADAPPDKRGRSRDCPAKAFRRKGRLVRPFSPAEDAVIIEMSLQPGVRRADIARRLNRKPHSVLGRQLSLARRDARQEEEAGI